MSVVDDAWRTLAEVQAKLSPADRVAYQADMRLYGRAYIMVAADGAPKVLQLHDVEEDGKP